MVRRTTTYRVLLPGVAHSELADRAVSGDMADHDCGTAEGCEDVASTSGASRDNLELRQVGGQYPNRRTECR